MAQKIKNEKYVTASQNRPKTSASLSKPMPDSEAAGFVRAQANQAKVTMPVARSIRTTQSLTDDSVAAVTEDPYTKLIKSGKKEDVSKRDAFSKHYPNGDGRYTAVITSGYSHYKKNGKWEEIKGEIQKVNSGGYAYANTENIMVSYYGSTPGVGIKSVWEKGEVKEFLNATMYWESNGRKLMALSPSHVSARAEGEKLFYDKIFGDISVEFTTLSGGRKLNYLIPDKEALGTVPYQAEFLVFGLLKPCNLG